MLTGPPPKPTALRRLQGNPGKRAFNDQEPQLEALTEAPKCPSCVKGLGRKKWLEVAPILTSAGILTAADLHNLESFCLAYRRWREAEAILAVDGLTITTPQGRIKHPAAALAGEAMKQMRDFGQMLGLDPSSRSRLRVDKPVRKNRFTSLPGGKST